MSESGKCLWVRHRPKKRHSLQLINLCPHFFSAPEDSAGYIAQTEPKDKVGILKVLGRLRISTCIFSGTEKGWLFLKTMKCWWWNPSPNVGSETGRAQTLTWCIGRWWWDPLTSANCRGIMGNGKEGRYLHIITNSWACHGLIISFFYLQFASDSET